MQISSASSGRAIDPRAADRRRAVVSRRDADLRHPLRASSHRGGRVSSRRPVWAYHRRPLISERGSSDRDARAGDRLPRRGRGGDGHGVHRRVDRSRGRPRHARRPAARRRRALAGRVSVRSAASGVPLLRCRVHRARHRRPAAHGPGGRASRARAPARDPRLLRRHPGSPLPPLGARDVPRRPRASRRRRVASREVPRDRRDGAGARATPARRRHVPRAHDPRRYAAAVRRRGWRPRGADQRARAALRSAGALRHRRLRQDGDRRDRVAADERRRADAHRLGAPARSLDAQSRRRAA